MKLCDLHTHSIYSDGSWPVEQLLDEAERIGLSAIALTDHNTISGLGPFMAAAEGRSVEAVPGTEFSLDYRGTEIHMLGLFIRPEHYEIVCLLMLGYPAEDCAPHPQLHESRKALEETVFYGSF